MACLIWRVRIINKVMLLPVLCEAVHIKIYGSISVSACISNMVA